MTDPAASTPPATDSLEYVRQQALELLLEEARSAAGGRHQKRFDALIARLIFGETGPQDDEPTEHELQMDLWRARTTVAMVGALFLIIVVAIFLHESGPGTAAGGFVSLFSGLAGIALGWLFGSGSGTLRRTATPKAKGSRRQKPPVP